MARRIVAHNPRKCKVEINPKLNSVADSFKSSKELHYRRAGEALSLTNEEAIEFLRSVGFSQIVPGTHFAPERDFAHFFGVDWNILHGYVYRYKLNSGDNPDESFSVSLHHFFKQAGLDEIGEVVSESAKSGVFDFHFKSTNTHYVTRDASSIRMLSARVAVAMIPLMACRGGKFYKSRVSMLNKELVAFLCKKAEQEKAIAEAEAAAKAAAEAEAKKEAELKAAIAEDTLYQLIKRAVSEVMSGATIAIAAPTTNT